MRGVDRHSKADHHDYSMWAAFFPTPPSIGDAPYNADADPHRDGGYAPSDSAQIIQGINTPSLPRGFLSSLDYSDNRVGYAGYIRVDEAQLYCVRFRHYDDDAGRWMQRDPAEFFDGNNHYQYSVGQPLNGIDPLGLAFYFSPQQYIQGYHEPILSGLKRQLQVLESTHGVWGAGITHWLLKRELELKAFSWATTGRENAAVLFRHYLNNSGSTMWVDISLLLIQSDAAYKGYVGLVNTAMQYVEGGLSPSGTTAGFDLIVGSWPDSSDWYWALGNYSMWARYNSASCAGSQCQMSFEIRLEDIYDFGGKLRGVQGLHHAGVAKSYWVRGAWRNTIIIWCRGDRYNTISEHPPRGGEQAWQ